MRRNDRSTAQITELNLWDLGLSDLELAIGTNSFTFREAGHGGVAKW